MDHYKKTERTEVSSSSINKNIATLDDNVIVNNNKMNSSNGGSSVLLFKKGASNDDDDGIATPATSLSASSSPSLPPSTPPRDVDDVPVSFLDELILNNNNSDSNDLSLSSTSRQVSASWVAPASKKSMRTHNPIRAIIDPIMSNSIKCGRERGDGKDQISLALGDPTAHGNIPPCPAIISAITNAVVQSSPPSSSSGNMIMSSAGYINACGMPTARSAIAKHHSLSSSIDNNDVVQVSPDDVIVANGASGALELALTALLDEDSVLLVPRPGFPLYQVIAESHGASVIHYDLLPHQRWECDLDHMESILLGEEEQGTSSTSRKVVRGILINNPSNPTGAVYNEEHLMQIIKLAEKYQVPIIADEIYGDMTFDDNVFHPMANVAARLGRTVPIITASGLGKQYLVPGWRLGWIVFHDSHHGAIQEVKRGAQRLAQVILGASHLAQVAIPAVLNDASEKNDESSDDNNFVLSTLTWKKNFYTTIEKQAKLLCGLLDECHGLEVIFPEGAMYAMVQIKIDMFDDMITDDVSFMKLLLDEENVVVLPGCAFGLGGDNNDDDTYVFRVVFCAPEHILIAASQRIASFCRRHKLL